MHDGLDNALGLKTWVAVKAAAAADEASSGVAQVSWTVGNTEANVFQGNQEGEVTAVGLGAVAS